ncbi:hypothetical protein ACM9PQ_000346 [Enterobacter mori]
MAVKLNKKYAIAWELNKHNKNVGYFLFTDISWKQNVTASAFDGVVF